MIRKGHDCELYRRGRCFFILVYSKSFRLKERDIFKSSPLRIKLEREYAERDVLRFSPEFYGPPSRKWTAEEQRSSWYMKRRTLWYSISLEGTRRNRWQMPWPAFRKMHNIRKKAARGSCTAMNHDWCLEPSAPVKHLWIIVVILRFDAYVVETQVCPGYNSIVQ